MLIDSVLGDDIDLKGNIVVFVWYCFKILDDVHVRSKEQIKHNYNTITHRFTHTYVTGEKLWLDRGSNPGPFADRANTLPLSYRATRSYHQQFSIWNLPRLHVYNIKRVRLIVDHNLHS